MKDIFILFVSICFAEFVHNIFEIWGMRQKVLWLDKTLSGHKHGDWPININTKTKTVILHAMILIIIGGIGFFLLRMLNLSADKLILIGILTLLINYIYVTAKVDSFHTEIGRLIKNAKNKP